MEAKKAEELLNDLFDNKFNQNKFKEFLTELFNGFETKDGNIHLRKEYNEYIEAVNFLGLNFNQKNRENIAFYAVKLKKQTSRDRARVMQRNLIGKLLDEYKRDSALVAFYNDEQDDWRFSFVKVDYEIDNESFETKKTFSSAKRYSYLIGPQEPNHSCKSRFLGYLIDETQTITIEQMYDIFSVEKVTNEFFEKYNGLFNKLKKSLDGIVKKDEVVKFEFEKKSIETADFAKKLLGQIVFIYFLQKKQWLGVSYEKEYGNGSKKFFEETYEYYKNNKDKYNNFFDDIVEPLFYDALNVQRDRDYFKLLDCKIPFLNGGLFDTINDYDWIKTSIKLEDSIFEEIIKTFNRFNFTIKEDEPLEKEVAVDPEMLGKVFENLLESGDRKAKGAFYTPREIVHYICQKTLINYLKNNIEVPEDTISEFIEKGYKLIDSIIRQQEEIEKGVRKKFVGKNLEVLSEHSEILLKLLNDVKVVDPAVGSGAFPVGMMNEIVNAKTILLLLKGKQEINNYELKREIIENSLYGVDIEYFALDVAKLRFWLSLIVDEESVEEIRPLPNLDHKLMCGNSLIEEFEGVQLFDKSLLNGKSTQIDLNRFYNESQTVLDDLRRLQKRFFNEENPNNKRNLKKEIDEKEWSLIEHTLEEKGNERSLEELEKYKKTNSKPFFVWELYFSEVFQRDNPGFNIVIGNPPYVRQTKIKEFKPYFNSHYQTYASEADLYVYFFEKGLNVLNNRGSLGYICSNMYTRTKYGKKLRNFMSNYQITNFNDYTGEKVFETATVDSSVIIINKYGNGKDILVNNDFYMKQERLNDEAWVFESKEILDLKDKIFSKGILIKDIDGIKINRGITTGFNEAFIINKFTKNDLISKDINNQDIIKHSLQGKNIKRYFIDFKENYLIATKNGINIENYPAILEYLNKFKHEKSKRPPYKEMCDRSDKGDNWYNLRKCSFYDEFEKPKLIWSEMVTKPSFSYTVDTYYLLNSAYFLTMENNKLDLTYFLSLLNSNLLYWYFTKISASLGSGVRYTKQYVEKLPIVLPSENEQKPLIDLANKMIDLHSKLNSEQDSLVKKAVEDEITEIDDEINNLVYELYDLTDDEIKIIEKNI
nr:TaqI-like C-terminal specificity domain-containing protein [Methanobrevibacter arboriphilus]